MVSVPQPQPDPTLVAQQQAAQAQNIQSIQQSLSDQQLNMLRQFGMATATGAAPTGMFTSGGTSAQGMASQAAAGTIGSKS